MPKKNYARKRILFDAMAKTFLPITGLQLQTRNAVTKVESYPRYIVMFAGHCNSKEIHKTAYLKACGV